MAGALIEGLLGQGCPASSLHVIDVHQPTLEKWQARSISALAAPDAVLEVHDVWVLAVKPQQLSDVVRAARPFLQPGTLVISIAAGIALSSLCQWLGQDGRVWPDVIRAMPNTPALVGQGITGLAAAPTVSAAKRDLTAQILSSVGEVVWVRDDDQVDAVTALSGSGPAYVFRFIEGLIEGGRALGLSDEQARCLAIATVSGAASLASQSQEPVSILRERVTSKGGTTAAALDVMASGQFFETVVAAMLAAHKRAGELSAEFGKAQG